MSPRRIMLGTLLASLLMTSAVSRAAQAADRSTKSPPLPQETKAQRDARMRQWREARFGMFIHCGLYAIPAGTWKGKRIPGIGEWIVD